jgi:cation diffusion facilitator CzcD-associated flavoprotein CzcO
MLDWLIVGGGVHGTHLSHVLLTGARVPRDRLRVLDPHPAPLYRWRECTRAVGMKHLRSPGVHHLDLDAFSLHQFARGRSGAFAPPYDRPSLAVFDEHCDHLIQANRLDEVRVRGEARALRRVEGGWEVDTDNGALTARRVVLAMGLGDQRAWTAWALLAGAAGVHASHVFDVGWSAQKLPNGPVLVVGGGITAAQASLTLADTGRPVRLWMRHPLRIHQFDSDPGWIGPRFMAGFRAETDVTRRRAAIAGARHRGSMPLDVADALGSAIKAGRVTLLGGEFVRATPLSVDDTPDGGARASLVLETSTGFTSADSVVLCTGFDTRRPGGRWLDDAVEREGLPCAPCSYPVVDGRLAWAPGLHVMGPLAELELGPTARNITGARQGAERIAAAA